MLLRAPPEFPGPSHVNYQIRSTLAGMRRPASPGMNTSSRCCADVRMYASGISIIYSPCTGVFLLLTVMDNGADCSVLDLATRTFIPQHPSDIMMFGLTEDLFAYWNTPFCEEPREATRHNYQGFGELINSVIPEVYLCRQYLNRLGYSHEPTIANWWRCLADLFLVVIRMSLEHFWYKYDYVVEHQSEPDAQRNSSPFAPFGIGRRFPPLTSSRQSRSSNSCRKPSMRRCPTRRDARRLRATLPTMTAIAIRN